MKKRGKYREKNGKIKEKRRKREKRRISVKGGEQKERKR